MALEAIGVAVAGHRAREVALSVLAAAHRLAARVIGTVSLHFVGGWHISGLADLHHLAALGCVGHGRAVAVRHAAVQILGIHGQDLHGHLHLLGLLVHHVFSGEDDSNQDSGDDQELHDEG